MQLAAHAGSDSLEFALRAHLYSERELFNEAHAGHGHMWSPGFGVHTLNRHELVDQLSGFRRDCDADSHMFVDPDEPGTSAVDEGEHEHDANPHVDVDCWMDDDAEEGVDSAGDGTPRPAHVTADADVGMVADVHSDDDADVDVDHASVASDEVDKAARREADAYRLRGRAASRPTSPLQSDGEDGPGDEGGALLPGDEGGAWPAGVLASCAGLQLATLTLPRASPKNWQVTC